MIQAANKPLDSVLGSLAVMALNICNQVIAFQNAIAARDEGQRYPTEKETGLLCKLINCLDKLKRIAAPHKTQQAVNGFIRFLATEDKDLAKLVAAKYKAYLAQNASGESEAFQTESNTPETPAQPVANAPELQTNDALFRMPVPETDGAPQVPPAEQPPITEAEFEQHKLLLTNLNVSAAQKTQFRGGSHGVNWLQYNLFQYCLPPAERKFHTNEFSYHKTINHARQRRKMASFFYSNDYSL